MTRAIPFLAGLVAAIVVFACSGAQAAVQAQSVGFILQHDGAATERLPFYRAAAPIAVSVRGDASRLAQMTVTATGPDGAAVTAPLVRNGDTFTGAVNLPAEGAWTLALSTQLGSVSAALANVRLQVVNQDAADTAARIAFALSALAIGAGVMLLVRRARRRARYET